MACRRVLGLFVAAVFVVGVRPLRADDSAPNRAERPAPPAASQEKAPPETSWTFDRGLYTNSPKTGKRVDRYAKPAVAYRDPNSFFDSPHEAFPFGPDPYYDPYYYAPYPGYGPYPFYAPYPYGPTPYFDAWPYEP